MRFLIFLFSVLCFQVSAQTQLVLQSEYLNKPDTVWVFTPENTEINKALPIVYLLHGWSGNYHHWDDLIDCQLYSNKYNTIIVCPDGLYDSRYIDSPVKTENKFESFFTQDLVPLISEKYNIDNDSIFITGLSMGGHGALYLFEMNPEYFSSAGSLSGLLDLTNWQKYYGISRILGLSGSENSDEILRSYSVVGNVDKITSSNKKIIVSCGTEDPFLNINRKFVDLCKSNGMEVIYKESPGGHNSTYWRSTIDDHFEFFFK